MSRIAPVGQRMGGELRRVVVLRAAPRRLRLDGESVGGSGGGVEEEGGVLGVAGVEGGVLGLHQVLHGPVVRGTRRLQILHF
jgi:hypothetical protein